MTRRQGADRYEIRVDGQLPARWSDWFEGLSIRNEPDNGALLSGRIVDQSALVGLLTRIHSLNMGITSVVRLPREHDEDSTNDHHKEREMTMSKLHNSQTGSAEAVALEPDASWGGLYVAGGISSILYIVLALVVPAVMIAIPNYDLTLGGHELLKLISEHSAWWMILQGLVLETSVLLIITSAALFIALKHVSKSVSAIGALVLLTSQILFMAYYPVLLGLTSLSAQYAAATGAQRDVFATAAEALIAQNNGFNPVYEVLFGAGIMILSLAMLKGVFHRAIAWIGIGSLAAVLIAMALFPVIGLAYFVWWVVPAVWCVAVGWRLIVVGRSAMRRVRRESVA